MSLFIQQDLFTALVSNFSLMLLKFVLRVKNVKWTRQGSRFCSPPKAKCSVSATMLYRIGQKKGQTVHKAAIHRKRQKGSKTETFERSVDISGKFCSYKERIKHLIFHTISL